jgi:hypothetical protein
MSLDLNSIEAAAKAAQKTGRESPTPYEDDRRYSDEEVQFLAYLGMLTPDTVLEMISLIRRQEKELEEARAERREEPIGIRVAIVDESEAHAELMRRAATCDDPSQWVCVSQGMSLDDAVAAVLGDSAATSLTPAPQGTASELRCWSCCKPYTLKQRGDADGDCPHCGVEIELDDAGSLTQAATSEPVADKLIADETRKLAALFFGTGIKTSSEIGALWHFVKTTDAAHLSGTTPNTEAPSVKTWEKTVHVPAGGRAFRVPPEVAKEIADLRAALSAQQAGVQEAPRDAATWLRNNYQDYPNVDALCNAMTAALSASSEAPSEDAKDAQRYRWLRNTATVLTACVHDTDGTRCFAEGLDDIIERAALASQGVKGGEA